MKKIFAVIITCACFITANAQLGSVITDAKNYNSANVITNNVKQVSATQIKTAIDKVIQGLDFIDTAKRFRFDSNYIKNNTKDSIKNLVDYSTLSTVGDFTSFNKYAKTLAVKDTVRGGSFDIYTGSDAADNGMIFADALGRKWKRRVSDTKINIAWYGAVAVNGIIDQRSYIVAARDYIYNHPESFLTLKIPASASGYYYVISDSILFNKNIRIEGEGTLWGSIKSKIYVATNKKGFVFRYNYGDKAASASVENLYFIQQTSTDKSTFAIKSCEFIHIKNVEVANFAGNGIIISSCATVPTGDNGNYGNADHSIVEYTSTYSCLNGIFIEGCDANVIEFNNISSNSNLRWGVFDNGFLGNHYLQPHLAANAYYKLGGQSTVSYGGKYYVSLPGHDGYSGDALDSNFNKQPDLHVGTYWAQIPAIFCGAWSSSTRYYSGGTIAVKSESAWTTLANPYAESAQPPFYLGGKSKIDNGDIVASGVTGSGAWWNMNAGEQSLNNVNLVVTKKISAGGASPAAPIDIQIHNDGITENNLALLLQSPSTNTVQQKFISTSGIGYQSWTAGQFGYFIGGNWVTYITAKGLLPGADNTFNLGSSGSAWKDFYAKLSSGAGTKTVRVDPSTGKFTYADTIKIGKIVASADLTTQTATTNICSYTNVASDGTFTVSSYIDVTAISSGILTITVNYTDIHSNSRTATFYNMGSTTAGLRITGSSNFGILGELRVKASTAITVAATLTAGTATFDASATITQLR